ncbi:TPA: DinI family protein [Klebsiella pneumoniae]|nr:virulence protein [Klebsiella pneumoniae]HDT4525171.1 DinI family protein [Klebsiella pneumoniae subsp. pneumoniae]SVS35086.1 virulence protein [Klebsiella pneumoniae]SVT29602.1 virulence protein [Klebsiella pneumoniae]HBR3263003.1 DinI family protein [Klebsiella pneumoniae]
MFVELIYDKRNEKGLEGAREITSGRVNETDTPVFPDAAVKVKPMQANASNSYASQSY